MDEKLARKVIERGTLIEVCSLLKIYGAAIDTEGDPKKKKVGLEEDSDEEENSSESKDLLNRFFRHLRRLIKENQLDIVAKGHVLHVIELRGKNWNNNQQQSTVDGNLINANSVANKIHAPIAFPDKGDNDPTITMTDKVTDGDYTSVHPRDYITEDFLIRNCDTSKGNLLSGEQLFTKISLQ